MYKSFFKRVFDIVASGVALVILSPVLLYTAYLVKTRLGSPVLFTQERPGKDGKIFKMYKFRSMTDERDENGELLPNEKRITPFGKRLRATSLDELPELINILKGDMSVVGPRPLLVEYLKYYSKQQMHRHDILPGLTGWAQINGRNNITWTQKFEYDLWYVENMSFALDMKIIYQTVMKVVKKDDINKQGSEVGMGKFNGSN